MPEYLIAFNAEWVPELTQDQLVEASRRIEPVIQELKDAGLWVFGGGLEDDFEPLSAVPTKDGPVFSDGPYIETKEHLGGFSVIDVPDRETARYWAGRIAMGCGWPMQVNLFGQPPEH